MHFVIDESSWHFDGLKSYECNEALEKMLDQLEDALAQDAHHRACYSEDLFNNPVWQDKIFYDLYSPNFSIHISNAVQERVASIFNGLSKWQDIEPQKWPPSFDVQVGNSPNEYAPSVAWAHEQTVKDSHCAIACVVFPLARKSGSFNVIVDSKTTTLWFVADKPNYIDFFNWLSPKVTKFFRDLIIETTKNPTEMEKFAHLAFPWLDFAEGAFSGIRNMSKPYNELVEPLVHHLGALSDHGKRIFGVEGTWIRVAAEFGSIGLEISDENGNTKNNSYARKERIAKFKGKEFICWWHTKLEPDRDRIHIFPDRIHNGEKLLVGIFCRHLTT